MYIIVQVNTLYICVSKKITELIVSATTVIVILHFIILYVYNYVIIYNYIHVYT